MTDPIDTAAIRRLASKGYGSDHVMLTEAERDALCDEVDRLRAEVDAMAAALAEIADGDCLEKPDICPPDDRCDVCIARHALPIRTPRP